MALSILFIGGTGQISLPCVNEAVASGHKVTVLNRGKTSVDLPRGVETIVGDMHDAAYGNLGDKHFDVVAQFRLYTAGVYDKVFLTQIAPARFNNYVGTIRPSIFRNYGRPITGPVESIINLTEEEIVRVDT